MKVALYYFKCIFIAFLWYDCEAYKVINLCLLNVQQPYYNRSQATEKV
jgi:hypothetical protein